jgi:hypothetical protein
MHNGPPPAKSVVMEKTTIEEIASCETADPAPVIPNRRKAPANKFRNIAKNGLYEFPDNSTIKFAWVGHQIRRVTLGHSDSVACPYCQSTVILGVQRLCCDPMGEATETVLRHIETESQRFYGDSKENRKASAGRTQARAQSIVANNHRQRASLAASN